MKITCNGGQQLLFSFSNILRTVIYPVFDVDVSVQRFADIFALILDMIDEKEGEYLYSSNAKGRKGYLPLSMMTT